jgi:predicted molibdopterin-dependent oxidoreductase YjgC
MHCGAMLEAALDVLYSIGGNFLETMPDPKAIRANLRLIPLRVHQDILLNSSMLEDAAELTILLPSKTRYEQEGGGTQTSTERRLRYSPEIAGHRIPEARAEWRILNDLGEALGLPMKLDDAEAIRNEMDRVMPMYRGIAQLKTEGDSFQYGGPLLCAQPDFVGRFSALSPPPERASGKFFVASRRGTQFNSMILKETDALTGCARDEIVMNGTDAMRLEIEEGDAVELRSPLGSMIARVALGDVKSGSIQAHWPECNGLIERLYDPASGEPDYNAEVTVRKLK